jgi:intracellular sulfur oxidation DsrE/DsrF family protein
VADASVLNATPAAADDPWLTAIAAKKHKAFMDVMHFFPDGTPFRRAKNLLNVMHESYGAAESDIGVAVGMHGRGLVHLVSQAAWNDLGLMEWLAPQLNGAEAAALKAGAGTFAAASAASVVELRARGVRFLACRETIAKWAQRVATQKGETPTAVSERIVRGLHEGVEPVPAMIAAAVVAQERGVRYIALS